MLGIFNLKIIKLNTDLIKFQKLIKNLTIKKNPKNSSNKFIKVEDFLKIILPLYLTRFYILYYYSY